MFTLFVLAGSVPCGVDTDIYKRIIEMVHKKGAKVLLDADGELFTISLVGGFVPIVVTAPAETAIHKVTVSFAVILECIMQEI